MSGARAVLIVLALALLAMPVVAHGNHVSADPQVTADGTVRIELAVVLGDAFVVLHTDRNGSIGRPVGHGSFEGFVAHDLEVAFDEAYWADLSGNVSLWVAVHRDDGDGKFDPGADPVLTVGTTGEPVADQFVVRRHESGSVNVIVERDRPQETRENRVTIGAVRLASDGYVVLRADEEGAPGRVVGKTALSAGVHEDVSVDLDRSFYDSRPTAFRLWAIVHTSDGDDRFEPGEDEAVRVAGQPVMSRFAVEKTARADGTPSPTIDRGTDTTSTRAGTLRVVTPSPAPTTDRATSTTGQPGFGSGTAFVGIVTALLVAVRRAR